MPHRRGTSLMETLVVITVMTLLSGIAVTMICSLMRADDRGAEALSSSMTFSRLARDFRRDVRAAIGAEVTRDADNEPGRLSLGLPGGRLVVYRTDEKQLVRSSQAGPKDKHTEIFRLPKGETRFEFRRDGAMLGLLHRRQRAGTAGNTPPAPAQEIQIWAAVGRDHRFRKQTRDDSQR